MITDVIKIFIPTTAAFFIGIIITPFLTNFLYKHRMWKHSAGKISMDGKEAVIFNSLHKDREISAPKMGGLIIWLSAFITISILWLLAEYFPTDWTSKLDILSRNQTWIPLFTLVFGGIIGLIDDWMDVRGNGDAPAGGLSLKKRLVLVGLIGIAAALWFYYKLDVDAIGLPFIGEFHIGIFLIPLFVLVMIGIYSGGVIDGIDGLAGGIFAIIFSAYAVIAFYQNQINLAGFCGVVAGSILAFLWFNIPPARFYMSETGSMGLTLTLTVVAFLTDTLGEGRGLIALPVIALPLILTSASDVIQVLSKKIRGKKVFQVAPLHHHFEAIGWPAYKVTMRYWVAGMVFAVIGIIIALIG